MKHIAWFDGSHKPGKAYFAYTIFDPFGENILEYKAQVVGPENSSEAEFAGLVYLLKKFKEMKIEEYDIFTDFKGLVSSLKERKEQRSGINYSLQIEQYFGSNVLEKVISNLYWKERKFNLADSLFDKIKTYDVIDDFVEIFCSSKIRKQEELKGELVFLKDKTRIASLGAIFTIPKTIYNKDGHSIRIEKGPLNKFCIALGVRVEQLTLKNVLKELRNVLNTTVEIINEFNTVFLNNNFVFHIKDNCIIKVDIKDSIIEKSIEMQKQEFVEKFEPKKSSVEKGNTFLSKNTLKRLKRINSENHITIDIPKTNFAITENFLGVFSTCYDRKSHSVIEHLSEIIENSIITEKDRVSIIVKGKLHLFCSNNTIFSYEIKKSDYTKEWENVFSKIS